MSIREMAVELVSSLTDEQVEHLIEFVKGFTGGSAKSDSIPEEKTAEEKLKSFEELDRIVKKNSHLIAADDYKEDLAAHRREKYGS